MHLIVIRSIVAINSDCWMCVCVQAKQTTVSEQKKAERQSVFQPPPVSVDKGHSQQDESEGGVEKVDVSAMKKKFSKALKKVSGGCV